MHTRPLPRLAAAVTFALFQCSPLAVGAEAKKVPDYAAWNKVNKDGSWTAAAENAVRATTLATLVPKDVETFCPAYPGLDAAQRTRFWAGLLSAMAKPESGFKPGTKYVEQDILDTNGQKVVSRGLLQISVESANQGVYGCAIKNAEDLHKVEVNLRCGARIMGYLVKQDGLVAAAAEPPVGAARYWSVLRAWKGHTGQISAFTKGMKVCQP